MGPGMLSTCPVQLCALENGLVSGAAREFGQFQLFVIRLLAAPPFLLHDCLFRHGKWLSITCDQTQLEAHEQGRFGKNLGDGSR